MTLSEFIYYVDSRLQISGLVLSEYGKKELEKRWYEKSDQGGYSDYWKITEIKLLFNKINSPKIFK